MKKSIKEQIKDTEDRINKLKEKLNKLYQQCQHEETHIEKFYFSGSYCDNACTYYYTYCSICHKKLNERIEKHSWFG